MLSNDHLFLCIPQLLFGASVYYQYLGERSHTVQTLHQTLSKTLLRRIRVTEATICLVVTRTIHVEVMDFGLASNLHAWVSSVHVVSCFSTPRVTVSRSSFSKSQT